jgi:hypothetical protein
MVDYKKWDALAKTLDEEDEQEQLLQSSSSMNNNKAAIGIAETFAQQYNLPLVLGQFIVIQEQNEGRDDNVDRYQPILKIVAEHPELMDMEMIDKLVDAALRGVNEGKHGFAEVAGAANTLLAMKKHGAIELFAKIATPLTEDAKKLRLRYGRREFVKEAFLQKTLGDSEFTRLRNLVQESQDDIDYCPKWCPCPPQSLKSYCTIC